MDCRLDSVREEAMVDEVTSLHISVAEVGADIESHDLFRDSSDLDSVWRESSGSFASCRSRRNTNHRTLFECIHLLESYAGHLDYTDA